MRDPYGKGRVRTIGVEKGKMENREVICLIEKRKKKKKGDLVWRSMYARKDRFKCGGDGWYEY